MSSGLRPFHGLPPRCFLRQFKRVFQAALHAAARVDGFLNGHFLRRALVLKTARAGVKPFVVFTHDDEINVLRPLVLERAILRAIKFHRTQVDVLFQFKTQPQQNALLQNARFNLRMADGAEENRLEFAQFVHRAVGQHFAGLEIALAAEIVFVPVELEAEFFRRHVGDFDAFRGNFRAGAVTAEQCNVVSFHVNFFVCRKNKSGHANHLCAR